MPKYKSYAKQGSFSDFEINVPDETRKIKQETQRQLSGMSRAEDFRRQNERVYLETQKYVQNQEELSRETNQKLENEERASYKRFLERDYQNRIQNLQRESAVRQRDIAAITSLSKTAASLIGQELDRQERSKRLAAMDVLARTGATYKDMLAFQKLDDNLTKEEFAAQAAFQKIIGPDGNPDLIDGFYKIYKNRNTKRWFEHKQLLQNTANGYPDFLEQKLLELQGEPIEDVDAFLTNARRQFLEATYLDSRVRPEVLQGAGVYTALNTVNNQYKGQLLKINRTRQQAELKNDRFRGFSVKFATDGLPGLRDVLGQNPSRVQRMHFAEWINQEASRPGGIFGMDPELIDEFLDMPGTGSNGQTYRQAFSGTADFAIIDKALDAARKNRVNQVVLEDKERQNQLNDFVRQKFEELSTDEDGFTQLEYQQLEDEVMLNPEYAGMTSPLLASYKRLTNHAQSVRATRNYNEYLFRTSQATVERIKGGVYATPQDYIDAVTRAQRVEGLMQDPLVSQHIERIKSLVKEPMLVQQGLKFGQNAFNVQRMQENFVSQYKKLLLEYEAANPDADPTALRKQAFSETMTELQKEQGPGKIDEMGMYTSLSDLAGEFGYDESVRRETDKQLVPINRVLVKRISRGEKLKQIAPMLDADLISKSIDNALTPNYQTPAIIRYIATKEGVLPFAVLQGLAPHLGDESLTKKIDALTKGMLDVFAPAGFQPERSRYRTYERVGRANVALTRSADKAPIRLPIVQYVSGDPSIAGKSNGRIVYDPSDGPRGHGGANYHNHYEFETAADALKAKQIFDNDERCRVTSYLRPKDTGSAHAYGVALDVAPDPNLPKDKEAEWSAYCNSLIGFKPNE